MKNFKLFMFDDLFWINSKHEYRNNLFKVGNLVLRKAIKKTLVCAEATYIAIDSTQIGIIIEVNSLKYTVFWFKEPKFLNLGFKRICSYDKSSLLKFNDYHTCKKSLLFPRSGRTRVV